MGRNDSRTRQGLVAAGETVTAGMVLVSTGTGDEVAVAAAGQDATVVGFAAHDANAGDLVLIYAEHGPFLADGLLMPSNNGAELKIGATDGRLALAGAAEAYCAIFEHRAIIGGQGGDPALGTGDHITAGNTGYARLARGVKA